MDSSLGLADRSEAYLLCVDFLIPLTSQIIISSISFIAILAMATPKKPAMKIATFSKKLSIPNLVHKSKTDIIKTKHIKAIEKMITVFLSLDFI